MVWFPEHPANTRFYCNNCRKAFIVPAKSQQKYCSKECRVKAVNKMKKRKKKLKSKL